MSQLKELEDALIEMQVESNRLSDGLVSASNSTELFKELGRCVGLIEAAKMVRLIMERNK